MAETENVPTVTGSMKLRLPFPRTALETYGIDHRTWQVLVEAVWPSAKTPEAVCLALSYCKARNLDPLKRPIHIVPVWSKTGGPEGKGGEVETIWPGISELRTTAVRTGVYAGKDEAAFGPDIKEKFQHIDDRSETVKEEVEITYPEWCRVTVYRLVQGVRCAFVGPKVYWREAYATKSRFSEIPNEMWADRKSGQLEKCAEAAALRAAFPEELGNEYSAEEMHGQVIDGATGATLARAGLKPGEAVPPRPKESSFARDDKSPSKPSEKINTAAAAPQRAQEPLPAARDAEGDAVQEPALASTPAPVEASQAKPDDRAAAQEEVRHNFINDAYASLEEMTKVREVNDLCASTIAAGAMSEAEEAEFKTACDAKITAIMNAAKQGRKK